MKEGCDVENGEIRHNSVSSTSSTVKLGKLVHANMRLNNTNKTNSTTGKNNDKNMAIAAANMSNLTGGFAISNNMNSNGTQTASTTVINNAKAGAPKAKPEGPARDKIFVCAVCNRCFGYKHVLQNHERTHTGEKPFECKECHKRFTRDHHLKTHMRLHTGEKPYHCTHCERQFVQVANLRRHLRVHTGERPYACELCTSKFSDSNQLKAHMLIHKGEKPFECPKCLGRFRRRHHLMHHKCPKDEANIGKPRRGRRPKAYDAMLGNAAIGTIIPQSINEQDLMPQVNPAETGSTNAAVGAGSVSTLIRKAAMEQFTVTATARLKAKRKPSHTQRVLPALPEHRIFPGDPSIQTQALDMRVASSQADMAALALDLLHSRMGGPVTRSTAGRVTTALAEGDQNNEEVDDDEGDEDDIEDVGLSDEEVNASDNSKNTGTNVDDDDNLDDINDDQKDGIDDDQEGVVVPKKKTRR